MPSSRRWLQVCLTAWIFHHFNAKVEAAATSCPPPIWLSLSNCTIEQANRQRVDSWGARLTVGSSPGQQLCVVPSTVVNNTILMAADVCASANELQDTPEQCRSRRGGVFDVAVAGSSFRSIPTSSLVPDPGWEAIMAPLGPYKVAGETTVKLPAYASVDMPVAVVTEGQNHTTSELGLGLNSKFLERMVDSRLIRTRGFGLNAGSQSLDHPRDGSLTLGGYDLASVSGPFTEYPMNYEVKKEDAKRTCPLQVEIRRLLLRPAGRDDIPLSDEAWPIPACIEPYDNLFRLPNLMYQLFQRNTGWTNSTTNRDADLLVPEPGLLYPTTTGFNASLLITLNNGFEVEIPNHELQHSLRGIAPNGSRVLSDRNITEVNIYHRPAPLEAAVLGKVFLSRVYLAVDYDAKRFMLARQTERDVTPNPVPFDDRCGVQKLSRGSTGAVVVGCVLALLLGVLSLACVYSRHKIDYLQECIEELDRRTRGLDQRTSGLDQRTSDLDQRISDLDQRTGELDQRIRDLLPQNIEMRQETQGSAVQAE